MQIFQIKRAKCHESLHKRREECDRLELGRPVLNSPKDLRYCENHPIEIIKGKRTSCMSAEGEQLIFK